MIESLLTAQVEILRRSVTGEDDAGNETTAFTSSGPVPAWVEQGRNLTDGAELLSARDTVVDDWLVVLMPDVVVEAYDQVKYGTKLLEVVGNPAELRTPEGPHHLELRCRWIEG